ncbi:MAG: carbon-nitrogen hydrolase, partial [Bacteroidota bacterium]
DDPAANLDRALAKTRHALEAGAQVVCLPELFQSRYFCQTEDYAAFDLAEAIPGPATQAFEPLAAEYDAALILSLFERRTRGLYHNTAAVIDGARGFAGTYRKMHIPDDPRYYEKFYFAPGDLGFKAFETPHATLGTLICWDQWYPEAARLTALRGAEVLFYPTAIGWHPEEQHMLGPAQHAAWETAQRAHAIANGVFVVAVNRTGFEPAPGGVDGEGIQFWGQSFVAAPDGTLLAKAPANEEATLLVEIDLGQMETMRQGWPFLRDRRIDAYDGLDRRFIDA